MNNKPFVGIWLDHREALMFWTDEQAEMQMHRVASEFQETSEPVDRVSSGGPNATTPAIPHASVERRRKEQLNHYYKSLTDRLRQAKEIYLFGPGQAKRELAHAIAEHKDMKDRLRAVESADHMTQPQMAARIREFFSVPRQG